MTYLVPFAVLKNDVRLASVRGQLKVDIGYDEFTILVKRFLQAIPVDEVWYRATYPDVDEAINQGVYRSARHHFIENGYFEERRPAQFQVDEAFYLKTYPDVAEQVQRGEISSAATHFDLHGYREGRVPSEVHAAAG